MTRLHDAPDGGAQVDCIACGATVARSRAREYDKHGDRWDRDGKRFEYLCKRCDDERCHRPRAGLEAMLVEAGAGEIDREEFLESFCYLARREAGAESEE
ncbi:DUF7562 family protein [Halorarius halobius]|uniref:DUF7562 family protein n=1 Tax=Halorarius halobius TaxID=2962671 RepID=UPI0020CC86F4|nr:hypothetical protein [Halorarius halobius]